MQKSIDAGVFLSLLCVPATLAQETTIPKVLTVCEALRDLNLYTGKVVVIVGHSGFTFDGTFMHEKCDPDDRILIQGHRWLSMIAVGAEKPAEQNKTFPVDEGILREKLSQLNEYLSDAQESKPNDRGTTITMSMSAWVAVYGTLQSPTRLKPHKPPSASNSHNTPGNGYGANGSVPAMILVVSSKAVPPRVSPTN
jgi:hypothetical protein